MIDTPVLTAADYTQFIGDVFVDERLVGDDGISVVVIDSDDPELPGPGSLPVVVLALGPVPAAPGPPWADAVVTPADASAIADTVRSSPLAATALAVHLRAVAEVNVQTGLALESALYSVLQAGPEFARWRAGDATEHVDHPGDRIRIERLGDSVDIVLQRGHHNPIDVRMRDELCGALSLVLVDDSIRTLLVRGDGPSFCSGGDLGEFGRRTDPATAHRVRLARSPARLMHRLSARTTVHVHGATLGGGLELAAFAGHVVADPATRLGLPEVRLGLVPGAGGTVSVTRRIGRQRTAHLALTAQPIDATTALEWGLVDDVRDVRPEVSARAE